MRAETFKGDTADMNGHVFQYRRETTDPKQYSVTLEKLTHYINKNFMSATDVYSVFKRTTTTIITKSVKPENDKDVVKTATFNEVVKEYVKKRDILHNNITQLYSVTQG